MHHRHSTLGTWSELGPLSRSPLYMYRLLHTGTINPLDRQLFIVGRSSEGPNSCALVQKDTPSDDLPVCVFKAPRTYTPVLGALVSPLGTQ